MTLSPLNQDLTNFIEALEALNLYDETLISKFRYLLETHSSPSVSFKPLAYGAYKEAYILCDGWVIKFSTSDNQDLEEMALLRNAREKNLDNLFLPTYYSSLHNSLPAILMDCWEDDYGKLHDYELTGYFIQPLATICSYDYAIYESDIKEPLPHQIQEYNQEPIMGSRGEPIPFETIWACGCRDMKWIADMIDIYGEDTLYKLIDFVKLNYISDLHPDNLGYYNNKPIIIDWLT